MKFDFNRRQCEFGVFNNRRENHGDSRVKVIDLPAKFPIKVKELDMVCPTQGIPLSKFLYGENSRKPALQTHLLSPMKVHRRPEHLTLTIYDNPSDKRKAMSFKEVRVKDPVLEFDDQGQIYVTCKFQFEPGVSFERINDNVEDRVVEFECRADQPELFDQDEEGGEEDEEYDEGQQSFVE